VFGIHQEHFHPVLFQNVVERNPVHPGRLHGDRIHSAALEPFRQPPQILGKAAELTHRLRIPARRDRHVMGSVAHINACRVRMHDLQTWVVRLDPPHQFPFLLPIQLL
jgi:hypothetical protein